MGCVGWGCILPFVFIGNGNGIKKLFVIADAGIGLQNCRVAGVRPAADETAVHPIQNMVGNYAFLWIFVQRHSLMSRLCIKFRHKSGVRSINRVRFISLSVHPDDRSLLIPVKPFQIAFQINFKPKVPHCFTGLMDSFGHLHRLSDNPLLHAHRVLSGTFPRLCGSVLVHEVLSGINKADRFHIQARTCHRLMVIIQICLHPGSHSPKHIVSIPCCVSHVVSTFRRKPVYLLLCQSDLPPGQHQLIGNCQTFLFVAAHRSIGICKASAAVAYQTPVFLCDRDLCPGVDLLNLCHHIHHIHPLICLQRAAVMVPKDFSFFIVHILPHCPGHNSPVSQSPGIAYQNSAVPALAQGLPRTEIFVSSKSIRRRTAFIDRVHPPGTLHNIVGDPGNTMINNRLPLLGPQYGKIGRTSRHSGIKAKLPAVFGLFTVVKPSETVP